MATNYPGSLDSYSTKAAAETIAEGHINDPQDAIEAIEAKVGTGASTPVVDTVLRGTGTGTTAFGKIDSGDASAVLGAWVDKSASYGAQQAATDGFVLGWGYGGSTGGTIEVLTDAASTPTTVRIKDGTVGNYVTLNANVFCPVKKGDYWMVRFAGDCTAQAIYWIPLGS